MILIFSWIHTVGHLAGSFWGIVNSSLEEINEHLMYKKFETKPKYWELLFKTTPGITGMLLLILVNLIAFASGPKCRWWSFQCFSLVHAIGVPLFLFLMVLHGSESWFNWHFPLTLITVPFLVFVFLLYFGIRIKDMLCWKFILEDVSITSNKEFIMLYIKKPKNYTFKPG